MRQKHTASGTYAIQNLSTRRRQPPLSIRGPLLIYLLELLASIPPPGRRAPHLTRSHLCPEVWADTVLIRVS